MSPKVTVTIGSNYDDGELQRGTYAVSRFFNTFSGDSEPIAMPSSGVKKMTLDLPLTNNAPPALQTAFKQKTQEVFDEAACMTPRQFGTDKRIREFVRRKAEELLASIAPKKKQGSKKK